EADLAVLLAALPLYPVMQPRPGVPPVPAETQPLPLTLDTLSRLYRSLRLSRALGLSATDYVTAIRVTGIEPFPLPSAVPAVAVRTRATVEFAQAVRSISDSGYSVAELAYLLRHESAPGLAAVVSEAQLAATLAAVRSDVRTARDAAGEATSAAADVTALRDRQVAAAAATLATTTGLTDETVRDLLMGRLSGPGGREPAFTTLLDSAFVDGDPDVLPQASAFGAAFALLRRIHKIALLASRLGFDRAQLGWLASSGPGQAGGIPKDRGLLGIDPNTIPAGYDAAEPAVEFLAFRRTLALARMRDRSPAMAGILARYVTDVVAPNFDDAHRAEALSAVAGVLTDALGVASDTATEAAARALPSAVDFHDPIALTGLFDLVIALAELGVTVAQLVPLTAVAPPFAEAERAAAAARALLRSRYGDAAWPDIIRPVSDGLRTRQRDALVDFLIHRDGLAGADELYERYLIDVLTAPGATTTRLLAATAAVQLFVQRCLIGLERVPISETVRRRWEWTKNYRVWEANRKVFLWPQNWLHPELREDASDAFRAAESALAQDEPSSENARTALLGYLDDLVELSQLSIVGMYQDRHGLADGDPWDLYLIGRTAGTPYRYFWRSCENFGGANMRWRPWERVDLDISGTHVMPFVLDGDLHLAWPVFRKNQTTPPGEWEMQLAWARRTSRGWSKKNVSRDTAKHPALANKDEPRSFTFALSVQTLPSPQTTSPLPLISNIVERVAVITCNAAMDTNLVLPHERDVMRSTGVTPTPLAGLALRLGVKVRVLRRKPSLGLYWPAAGTKVTLKL
ncbi:MAG TPA: neuraminidase-like domain-containing protein, partial [Kribbellaceae bacterium]